jgi:hypothetical protein
MKLFHRLILYRFSENNYQIKKYENTPLERFYNLLALDRKMYIKYFLCYFVGLISLSLPLGIQAIINFIQSGRVSAS